MITSDTHIFAYSRRGYSLFAWLTVYGVLRNYLPWNLLEHGPHSFDVECKSI